MSTPARPVRLNCHSRLRGIMTQYWDNAHQAEQEGKKIAWCSGIVPAEFLTAMDFFTVYCMNNSATCASQGVSLDLCRIAEEHGFSPDLCSYPRTDIGSALAGEQTLNPLKPPKPDLLLVANGQCHSITKWLESLGMIYGAPVVVIDVPFMHDHQGEGTYKQAHAYVVDQLQELVLFLETFTGRRFDYDKLTQDVSASSRMFNLWKEALDFRSHIPSPLSAFDIFTHLFPVLGLRGSQTGADYYRDFKDEVEQRVQNRIGALADEKYRLYLDGVPMWFNLRGMSEKLFSAGANTLVHPYPIAFGSFARLDDAKPFDSTAESLLLSYANLGVKQRARSVLEHVEQFHLDGLVMQISRTCKALSTGTYDIIEEVEKAAGIPGIAFETDMCDPRLYSEAQVFTKLDAFFETLSAR